MTSAPSPAICPDEAELARFVEKRASHPGAAAIEAHIDRCEVCREVVAELARSDEVRPGERIGRYQAEELLGAGGMGIVLAARDPELGRPVAIKLLRASQPVGFGQRGRLLREAMAMASLSHPNVVTIYDVGEHNGEVYLAMELIPGRTLRSWMDEKARSWKEIVPILVQAGRGLAAAHELGIVHRDLKPENIFLGNDGRARVGDFGLASLEGSETAVALAPDTVATAHTRTGTGALVGTPAYMAPEQLAGERADALTDQFAFCVTLHEALYGSRPFAGATVGELAASFREGVRSPRERRVPPWLVTAVERGLRIEPRERFPSMTELLHALTEAPARQGRRRIAALAVGGLLAFSLGAYAIGKRDHAAPGNPCLGAHEKLARVYGPERAARLRAAFAAAPKDYVRELGPTVMQRLAGYTIAWVRVHEQACEATLVRGEQSSELMDLRMECLGERLRQVSAVAEGLTTAAGKELGEAMEAMATIEPLAICSDERTLRARRAPRVDPLVAPAVAAIRAQLLSAGVASAVGSYGRSLEIAEQALASSVQIRDAATEAEARLRVGKVLIELNRGAEASAQLHAAAARADAARHDEMSAQARVELIRSVGVLEANPAESDRIVPYAEASIQRLGGDRKLAARLIMYRASTITHAGRPHEALPLSLLVVSLFGASAEPDDLEMALAYNRLATDLTQSVRLIDGIPYFDRAIAAFERVHGGSHPGVATILRNRGITLRHMGRYDEAKRDLDRALAIRERVFGPDDPEVAVTLASRSAVSFATGDIAGAHRDRERALAIGEATLPANHSTRLIYRVNHIQTLVALHRDAEAIARCEPLILVERAQHGDRPRTGMLMAICAVPLLRTGQGREARRLYDEGEALLERLLAMESSDVADYVSPWGEALLALGKPREALPYLERMLDLRRKVSGPDSRVAVAAAASLAEARTRTGAGTR